MLSYFLLFIIFPCLKPLLKSLVFHNLLCVNRPLLSISENQAILSKMLIMLAGHFAHRVYSIALVIKALEKAEKLKRSDLLDKQLLESNKPTALAPEGPKTFYCITTHNPKNPPNTVTKN